MVKVRSFNEFKFFKGKGDFPFFDLLGVSYGLLFFTNKRLLVSDPETLKQWLQEKMEEGAMTEAETQTAEKAMLKRTKLDSRETILEKARHFLVPENMSPLFYFKPCTSPNCPIPLPHGNLFVNKLDLPLPGSPPISTILEAIHFCNEYVKACEEDRSPEAVILFQQIIEADLCFSHKDFERRLAALPEEKRRKLEKRRPKNGKNKPN